MLRYPAWHNSVVIYSFDIMPAQAITQAGLRLAQPCISDAVVGRMRQ
jgi:hypothetical protein